MEILRYIQSKSSGYAIKLGDRRSALAKSHSAINHQLHVRIIALCRYTNTRSLFIILFVLTVAITDDYLPKFQKMVDRAQALRPTTAKYLQAKNLYVKSLQSEIGSYMHFRNFLATGSKTEDNTSTQLYYQIPLPLLIIEL